jgi:WD40 repeat protein
LTTRILRRSLIGACLAVLCSSLKTPVYAQQSASGTARPTSAAFDQPAYLHYLLALRFATDGIPYAALHEAATSLRLQASNNPAAGLAFQLIASQRQGTHIRLCCFQANVIAAHYSADGMRIMTALDDKTIRVWDAATGRPLFAPMQHEGDILAAVWSADGKRIASSSGDGKVHLWDAVTGMPARQPFVVEQPIKHIALSPNGDAILGSHSGAVSLWNTVTGAVISPKPYHDDINVLTFSNDGKYALIATNDDVADIVDAATAKRLHRLPLGNAVFNAVFSKDSRFALTASEDHTAHIWDANTGAAQGSGFTHSAAVADAQFSQDGKLVLTSSFDHTARIWNAETGAPMTPLLQHRAGVLNGGFSADGSLAFTRARDMTIHVWNVATGEAAAVPIQNIGDHNDVAFSPTEQKLLVASGNSVEIVDEVPGEAPPAWLADLADFEAGRSRFDQAPVDNRALIEKMRQTLLASRSPDAWTQFARWYFTAPQERTVSPWSRVLLGSYVDDLIHIHSRESLAYARQVSAGHPAWLLRIAEAEKKELPSPRP